MSWSWGWLITIWCMEYVNKAAEKLKNKKPKIIESRNLNKYDKVAFQYDLQQIEWETILSPLANYPNSMAVTIQEIFE